MLILLPPSEGQGRALRRASPVDLDSLAFAAAARRSAGEAARCAGAAGARVGGAGGEGAWRLGGPGRRGGGRRGAAQGAGGSRPPRSTPASSTTASAFPGCLPRLGAGPREVLIASALWGFVRPEDRIPYYRFSAKARLEGSARSPPGGARRSPRRCPTSPASWSSTCAPALTPPPGSRSGRRCWRCAPSPSGRQAQGRLPHGKGGAGRSGPGAAAGEEVRRRTPRPRPRSRREAGFEVELTPGSLDVIV